MMRIARSWRVAVAGLAVAVVGVLGLACPTASADPVFPPRPDPVPIPAAPVTPQALTGSPGAVGYPLPGTAVAAPAAPSPALAAPAPAVPPPAPMLVPAQSGTLRDYFAAKNVKMEPQKAQNFSALDVTLPMPPGWTQVPDPNVPDAFVVTANRRSASLYTSNAQLVVYRLVGDFDPKDAITHGYLDSEQLPAWRTTNASLADFNGSPSSIIEGTYRENEMTLNTSRRHVIVASGPDQYLVSLAVTTDAAAAVGEAPATDAIVNGFRVGPPGSNPPAAAPGAVAAPPSAAPLAH
ncbi:LpqN/LpqT family lipoprotein [Candidatus Mycobacterium methanotrophicum]|uniref:LpqN/LpqT family lipoprotein n=1 Tax=Candidatus Mycobacterium methanotrophicum TaxID=2943498 RepID=A0ABY4QMK9_9MYCO|nr:LpqN/LpqT family lipoprotein [Candidatus Mycobacterium methanotrophicum]UQX11013.1 LpqN/LpqT family lipoprotein [Candidatus Mycobacterium methanotrophicum]